MIKRGDIYFIRDTRQSIGSEQKADRPAGYLLKKKKPPPFMKLSI